MRLLAQVGMPRLLVAFLACAFVTQVAIGQTAQSVPSMPRPDVLTIVNSRQIDMPGERARVLLLTTCRVVAEEFHQKPEDVDLKVTLLLGESNEHLAIDDSGRMTLYLERWDETKFVDGVITGAIQKLTPLQKRKQMFTEIRRRTEKIAPIPISQLRISGTSAPTLGPSLSSSCINAVNSVPCSWPKLDRSAH
jgi:hypothetical protein